MKAYPTEILPGERKKLIHTLPANSCLIRKINTSLPNWFDEEIKKPRMVALCSPKEGMRDLSTGLLGVFRSEHFQLDFSNHNRSFFEPCAADDIVPIPIIDSDYAMQESTPFVVYFCVEKIKSLTFDYQFAENTYSSNCLVAHTPAKWNYWHFSIRWDSHEGEIQHFEKPPKWVSRLCEQARHILYQHMKLNKSDCTCAEIGLEIAFE